MEMKNVRVAFKILDDTKEVPIGYKYIQCHMIFDVKMEDFRRRARLVAGGDMTDAPAAITYAGVLLSRKCEACPYDCCTECS